MRGRRCLNSGYLAQTAENVLLRILNGLSRNRPSPTLRAFVAQPRTRRVSPRDVYALPHDPVSGAFSVRFGARGGTSNERHMNFGIDNLRITTPVEVVPAPSTLALMALAGVGLLLVRRRLATG
jgi:hypothetical protein